MSLARCWGRVTNLTVTKALGCTVWDVDGKSYLDCASGIAVVNTGHCHPHVVAAIQKQAAEFIHCQVNVHYNEKLLEYAGRLQRHMPEGIDTFFFSNSGAEAVEGTVKLIRAATKRMNVVGMKGAFHGRTATAMALTTSGAKYKSPCFPEQPNVLHVDRPLNEEDVDGCIGDLSDLTRGQASWDSIAGVVIEPVQGEGGFHVMSPRWMRHLATSCAEHGALFVADEVQAGFGRCGKMFGHQLFPDLPAPDVVVFGKGVAGGLPFAGFAARKDVMDALPPGSHGGTYGGNPVAAAAAVAVLDVLEEPGFLSGANDRAATLLQGLRSVQKTFPSVVTAVRGTGMMIGFDLPTPELARAFVSRMLEVHRIIFFAPCGVKGTTLRIMPPLVVSQEEVGRILEAVDENARHFAGERK